MQRAEPLPFGSPHFNCAVDLTGQSFHLRDGHGITGLHGFCVRVLRPVPAPGLNCSRVRGALCRCRPRPWSIHANLPGSGHLRGSHFGRGSPELRIDSGDGQSVAKVGGLDETPGFPSRDQYRSLSHDTPCAVAFGPVMALHQWTASRLHSLVGLHVITCFSVPHRKPSREESTSAMRDLLRLSATFLGAVLIVGLPPIHATAGDGDNKAPGNLRSAKSGTKTVTPSQEKRDPAAAGAQPARCDAEGTRLCRRPKVAETDVSRYR